MKGQFLFLLGVFLLGFLLDDFVVYAHSHLLALGLLF